MASCGEVEHFSSFGQPCPSNHHSRPGWALQHSSDWAPQSNKVLLLEPEILAHFDKQWIVPDHHGTFLFHSSVMHAAGPLPCPSPAQEIKNKLEDLLKNGENYNCTSFEGYITRDQLVSCHVVSCSHFGGVGWHFPCDFWLLPCFPWPLFCLWHQGVPYGNIHFNYCYIAACLQIH